MAAFCRDCLRDTGDALRCPSCFSPRILRHAEITQHPWRAQAAGQAKERKSRILTIQRAGQSLAGVSRSGQVVS